MTDTKKAPTDALKNLGPKSRDWLAEIGVHTEEDLRTIGAVSAFQKIKEKQGKASLLLLYAMHAALQNRDWRDVTEDEKELLKSLLTDAET